MRNRPLILLAIISLSSYQLNWFGDIDLGSGFYYLVEPAFNSIVIPVNPNETYKSSIYIIKDIESVGFNKKHILVTSKDGAEMKYWLIDKNEKTKKLGFKENSIMELSNASEIDSAKFSHVMISENIELKTKAEYRKDLNYE